MKRWSPLILVFVAACAGSIPAVTPDSVRHAAIKWPSVGETDLMAGRKLYVTKCSGCHSLYEPSKFTAAQWDTTLAEMSANAKLTPEETERVYQYLYSCSK